MGSWSGCFNMTTKFVPVDPPRKMADYYIEYSFLASAGTLEAHGSSLAIINWFYKNDWSYYRQTNDFSFMPCTCVYVDNPRMTLYRNGVLIWGTEPPPLQGSTVIPETAAPPPIAPTFQPPH
jgi:hypothetical protein